MSIDMPEGWKTILFGEAITLKRGYDLPVKSRIEGAIPVLASNGIIGQHNDIGVKGPGVVTGRSGTIGKVIYYEDDFWPLNTTLYVQDFHGHDPKWVYWFLTGYGLERHSTGTGVPTLNRNIVHQDKIKLPPLPEQKKIAAVLGSVDKAIAATEAVIAQTRRVKQGLLTDLLTQGIGHKKFKQTQIGKIPESWKVVALENIATVERGKFSARPRNDPQFYGGEIPFVQTGDITRSYGYLQTHTQTLNKAGLGVSKMFQAGVILITIAANIGDTAITEYPVCCPDSLVAIQPYDGINLIWLRAFMVSMKPLLNQHATQNAQKNINLQNLKPLLVALPTVEEQKEIGSIVMGIDSNIQAEQTKLDQIKRVKKGLMADLLIGKKRVSV